MYIPQHKCKNLKTNKEELEVSQAGGKNIEYC